MGELRYISVNLISDPEWNSRTLRIGEEAVEEKRRNKALAEDIAKRGIQTPIEVEGPNDAGGYLLVYGSRRLAGARVAGLTEVPCLVNPLSTTENRKVRNALENLQRSDLTTFEKARVCAELRKTLSLAEVSQLTGLSIQRVSNLTTMHNNLDPSILADWQGGAKAAQDGFLRELANVKDPRKQVELWDAETRRVLAEEEDAKKRAAAGDAPKKKKGEGSGAAIRAVGGRLAFALDTSKAGKTPSMLGDGHATVSKVWLRGFLDWLIGQTETPPPGLEPPKSELRQQIDKDMAARAKRDANKTKSEVKTDKAKAKKAS